MLWAGAEPILITSTLPVGAGKPSHQGGWLNVNSNKLSEHACTHHRLRLGHRVVNIVALVHANGAPKENEQASQLTRYAKRWCCQEVLAVVSRKGALSLPTVEPDL